MYKPGNHIHLMRYSWIMMGLLLLLACEEVIDLPAREVGGQWVVSGLLSNSDQGNEVKVFRTAAYGQPAEPISSAMVRVIASSGEVFSLRPGAPGHYELQEAARQQALESMADVALTYRPDANEAPELFENVKAAPRIISKQNAYLIQDMMRDVIRRGTGRRALQLGRSDLSGKTGTSNDRRDAWFAGFNAGMSSIVWVGYDDDRPLGPREEGSRTALPIWIDFAREALRGVEERQMPVPEGIVTVRISKSTGCPANTSTDFADVMFESFRIGNVPECKITETLTDPFNIDEEPVTVVPDDPFAVEDEFGTAEVVPETEEEETLF